MFCNMFNVSRSNTISMSLVSSSTEDSIVSLGEDGLAVSSYIFSSSSCSISSPFGLGVIEMYPEEAYS